MDKDEVARILLQIERMMSVKLNKIAALLEELVAASGG